MSNSEKSASELRALYQKGGSLGDHEMSASELRARHGIRANAKNFSTGEAGAGGGGSAQGLLLLSVAVAVIAVLAAYAAGLIKA